MNTRIVKEVKISSNFYEYSHFHLTASEYPPTGRVELFKKYYLHLLKYISAQNNKLGYFKFKNGVKPPLMLTDILFINKNGQR